MGYWLYTKRSKDKEIPEKMHCVFNYWLSRARMCIECAFGILTSWFCFLMQCMILSPDMASVIVKAACVLHNYLAKGNDPIVQDMEAKLFAELERDREEWREWNYRKHNEHDASVNMGLHPVPPLPGYHSGREARQVQNLVATYFRSPDGYTPWQDKCAYVTDLPNWRISEKHKCTGKERHSIDQLTFDIYYVHLRQKFVRNFNDGHVYISSNDKFLVTSPDPSTW